jgi:DNA polymerase sigma
MTVFSSLASRIKSAISNADVAIAANVNATEWSNNHVFDGGRSYVHGQNRGRVPFVNFWRNNSNFSFDAVGPDIGGQTDSTWIIQIIVCKSMNTPMKHSPME